MINLRLSLAVFLLTEEVMLAEEDKNAEEKSPLDGRSFCCVLFLPQHERFTCCMLTWLSAATRRV